MKHLVLQKAEGRKAWWLLAFLFAFLSLPTPQADAGAATVYVVSYSPRYSWQVKNKRPIQIRFNKPMVAQAFVGKVATSIPVQITPALRTAPYWSDRQTLVIKPLENFTRSTKYTITINAKGMARPVSKSFVYAPVRLTRYKGIHYRYTAQLPSIELMWNQDVKVAEVLDRCRFVASKGHSSVKLKLITPQQTPVASNMTIRPVHSLTPGKRYRFKCMGLKGIGGNYSYYSRWGYFSFRVRETFRIVKYSPKGLVRHDSAKMQIHFSTPVKRKDLQSMLVIEPTPKGFKWKGTLDYSRTTYTTYLKLEESQTYTIRLKPGLTDDFGRKLEEDLRFAFVTAKAQPRIVVERGRFSVEATRGYPVWLRDLGKFNLTCARVPLSKMGTTLHALGHYKTNPLSGNPNKKPIKWKKLGLTPQNNTVNVNIPEKKWTLKYLQLGKLCDNGNKNGLYVAEFTHAEKVTVEGFSGEAPPHRIVANITNMFIVAKTGERNGIAWVTNLKTGQPVSGANVDAFDANGKKVFSGVTNAKGLIRLPSQSELRGKRYGSFLLVAKKANDVAVFNSNWRDGLYKWSFGVPTDSYRQKVAIRGFIQSDRGIYRPGETVHFKGLVREIAFGTLPRVPGQKTLKVKIINSRREELYNGTKTLTEFGGFSLDLKLKKNASLGDYYVKATLGKKTFVETFSVQEFRKVSFTLALRKVAEEQHTMRVKVSGQYLFGSPLTGAKVDWRVYHRRHYLSFPKHAGYSFYDAASSGHWYYNSPSSYRSYLASGNGTLDANGELVLSFKKRQVSSPWDYIVEATATDKTNQAVSKSKMYLVHSSDTYVGVKFKSYVGKVGEATKVLLRAVDQKGRRVAANAQVEFYRTYWKRHCKKSGYCRWRQHKEPVSVFGTNILASGVSTADVTAKVAGTYFVRVTTTDKKGRKSVASSYIWMSGGAYANYRPSNSPRMKLLANKASYKVGETAKIVPNTHLSGTALVTVERDGVADAFITQVKGGKVINLPIKKAYAPNVFVSVFTYQTRKGNDASKRPRFQMGVVQLKVSTKQHKLKVVINTDKETYKPGDKVSGVIKVLSGGQPVRSEVSLSVADEGVLQLINYKTPAPKKTFYAPWGWGVDVATSLVTLLYTKSAKAIIRQQGSDGGPMAASQAKVRSKFVSSAFWAPHLITNAKGEVRFSFKLPDNLTSFRLMAVAADKGSKFGSGQRNIRVRKDLMATPILPRFLVRGDVARVGIVLHNYSKKGGKATVIMQAKGVEAKETQKETLVSKNGSTRVLFDVRAKDVSQGSFLFIAKLGKHKDAVLKKLPINQIIMKESQLVAKAELKDSKITTQVSWPQKGVFANQSRLNVSMDRTGVLDLREGLMYLVRYPYGCLEQTLSKTIPLTKARELLSALKLKGNLRRQMKKFLKIGLAKIVRHQHANGHFSLWPGGTPQAQLTAYALYGLNEAKKAGLKVDERAIKKGLKALHKWSQQKTKLLFGGKSGTLAMAAFVLAELGKPNASLNARLYEARQLLPTYGKGFLLRAMKRSGTSETQLKAFLKEITSAIEMKGAIAMAKPCHAMFSKALCRPLAWYMSSTVRTTAILLSAILEVSPKHPLIPMLVRGLKSRQNRWGRWSNTQENIYSLVAIADHARTLAKGSSTVQIRLKNSTTMKFISGRRVVRHNPTLKSVPQGPMTIEAKGTAHVRAVLNLVGRWKAPNFKFNGFSITRLYLDPETNKVIDSFKVGQVVKVRVIVKTPKRRYYVAMTDRLPAGFEAINEGLATTSRANRRNRRSYIWNYVALKDDRIYAFANNMYSGTHTFEYRVRATLSGTFSIQPAKVEAMYSPHIFGRTNERKMSIQP